VEHDWQNYQNKKLGCTNELGLLMWRRWTEKFKKWTKNEVTFYFSGSR
jgi:hypothetical protein